MFLWHASAQCEQAGVTAITGYFSCPHEELSGYSVNIDLSRARAVATIVALPVSTQGENDHFIFLRVRRHPYKTYYVAQLKFISFLLL